MSGAFEESEILELLFNKSFGVATTLPGANLFAVSQDNAGEKIIPVSQIFTQEIPTTAPIDLIVDLSFSRPINPSGAVELVFNDETFEDERRALTCKRSYSQAYPWIVKYENFQLIKEQAERSYHGKITPDKNLLAQTIPFNYDAYGGYGIKVLAYIPGDGNEYFGQWARDDPTLSWNYENDAGFITFYGNRSTH